MAKASGRKSVKKSAPRKKAAVKDATAGMTLDHDVAIPKNFPLKLNKKPKT